MADNGVDLIVTSGGLGPTADDMTVEMVAEFSGRPLVLDEALEGRIADILRGLMRRFGNRSFEAVCAANRKQALVPEGSHDHLSGGHGPGGGGARRKPAVVVLPGPPRELQPMWAEAVETETFREATAGRRSYVQAMMRLFGSPESSMAETLRAAESEIEGFDRLEITTCLRRAEVEVVTRYEPEDAGTYAALVDMIAARHPRELFSTDGSLVDDQVAELLAGRRIATAESCTAGLVAARLTERPGSSAYFAGGVVAYANEVKEGMLGVDPALLGAARRGVARGGLRDGRGGARAVRCGPGRVGHGSGRARAAEPRRSRSAPSASACARPTGPPWPATCCCPEAAPTSASARRRW